MRCREAKAVCKQASLASRDVQAGPWEGRHARPRPGQTRRAPVRPPARSSHTRPRRNPGPGKGFSAARGLVAPRVPPASWGAHGKRAKAPELRGARGGRSARTLRPPGPRADARAPERRKPASPAPRRATLTASPWPGGRPSAASLLLHLLLLLLSRAPPRSLALLRGLRSLRRRPRPGAPPAASAPGSPQPLGSGGARSSAFGGAGYGGTTEALQADRLGKASGAAVAAPASRAAGPQRPLDPTSRYGAGTAAAAPSTSGREREAARPRGGWGPVCPAPPAARP
ncbi:translation initiation factor IF-2-like [Mesocricetus auratus]|uniref:Translation initiation factor IF-2-like n=1 Tax=Mesocricetus auratus TaxID=10036 RepID=A0ABM2YDQ8_MESAU|nr:translation initiation factor IF-2-like [Mesocricetus auratus]